MASVVVSGGSSVVVTSGSSVVVVVVVVKSGSSVVVVAYKNRDKDKCKESDANYISYTRVIKLTEVVDDVVEEVVVSTGSSVG